MVVSHSGCSRNPPRVGHAAKGFRNVEPVDPIAPRKELLVLSLKALAWQSHLAVAVEKHARLL